VMVIGVDPDQGGQGGRGGAVILFTKVPRPGLVKTRLIPPQGPPFPSDIASLYVALLQDTLSAVRELQTVKHSSLVVSFTPSDGEMELSQIVEEFVESPRFMPQVGSTVTEKVRGAFEVAFRDGYSSVVLIPGDHADLSGSLIGEALEKLARPGPAVVLGPTCDGGAFLLGFNRASFERVAFDLEDTHLVCADIFRRTKAKGIPCSFLDNRSDIDDWEDARHFLLQKDFRNTRTWKALHDLGVPQKVPESRKKVSVIVPTLNEESAIDGLLGSIRRQSSDDFELILVDGGSRDGTVDKAWGKADSIVFVGKPSRRGQEIVAAADARGDTLLFLHADTVVPPTLLASMLGSLSDPAVQGGSCRVIFRGRGPKVSFLNALRLCGGKLLNIHGISSCFYIRRTAYEQAGGFREDVMEEAVDLRRRAPRSARFVVLNELCTTSARRFERRRRFLSTLVVWVTTVLLTRAGLHFTKVESLFWKSVREPQPLQTRI